MRIDFRAFVEVLDRETYLAAVRESIRAVFIKAARQFLLAAVPRVPIWTGFSRGAFKNLEDVVGQVGQDKGGLRIRGTRTGGTRERILRREYYFPYGTAGSGILKTTQSGRQFATPPGDIFDFSGASITGGGRTRFSFNFEVDITYFNYWDRIKWMSFKNAEQAFSEYVETHLEFPDFTKYTKRVKVGV